MILPPSCIEFLVRLGWSADDLNAAAADRDVERVYHRVHPGIYVAEPVRSHNPHYFRMGFDPHVRSGDDRIYAAARECERFPCLVDVSKPRWTQSVVKWFQRTVFETKPARVAAEDEAARKATQRAKVREALGDLAHQTDNVLRVCTVSNDPDTGELNEVHWSYSAPRLKWTHDVEPLVSVPLKLRRVAAVFEAARVNGLKFL